MSQARDEIERTVINMTDFSIKENTSASLPFTAERAISSFEGKVKALESRVFDVYRRDHICVECGSAIYEIGITEESTGIGKNKVICRIIDCSSKTTYTQRGRSAGAVQVQSIGWLIDLTDMEQVKMVLKDRNNPESLKAIIRSLIKGDLSGVGDPTARR